MTSASDGPSSLNTPSAPSSSSNNPQNKRRPRNPNPDGRPPRNPTPNDGPVASESSNQAQLGGARGGGGRRRGGGGGGGRRDGGRPTQDGGQDREGQPSRPRRERQQRTDPPAADAGERMAQDRGQRQDRQGQPPRPRRERQQQRTDMPANDAAPKSRRPQRFNAALTEPAADAAPSSAERYSFAGSLPAEDSLTGRLIHTLSTPPYPDCPICFNIVHPAQPTWCCSPTEGAQCCWTPFHLKCVRAWAEKSVKDLEAAWRARGEAGKRGEWRCPGCQARRFEVPTTYWCFCGSTADPKPPRLATPHSCAGPCTRPRACGHPCALACHPGPCPPCQVSTQLPCFCGKETIAFRCANKQASVDLSCRRACGKRLGCGNHVCAETCHDGACPPCVVRETARCYCGREEKEVACGDGVEEMCETEAEKWMGRFECGRTCDRPFACGLHACTKTCHPPSRTPPRCPRDPALVTHCPCGKHALDPSEAAAFPAGAVLPRRSCADAVPTCASLCLKQLAGCAHACGARCHAGACPPCGIMVVRPCRCGATTRDVACAELQRRVLQNESDGGEVLCDRACTALRACGRHQCNRVCCPLASLAAGRGKGKGKRREAEQMQIEDGTGLHVCDLVCGKMLGCGNHHCEERDHRGVCPPCLRSSFEEMVCHCRRTVLEPPIPCGTRIRCAHPCARAPPPCGHGRAPHACHGDDVACPPCPFLTSKACACGKKAVGNVRCSQEKVSCGAACGRLLGCGFHRCARLCHAGECGACNLPCGKARRLCLPAHHPCTLPCHAPASCSEAEPCETSITMACPCGRIRQNVLCARCTGSPAGREAAMQIKCSNECAIAKRNARLAEALGISPGAGGERGVVYADEVVAFGRANARFMSVVEKAFEDFIKSDKKTQVLPHMPQEKRKFVHDLASVYRMDTQMVDQEPRRSVQLIRRIDTRAPVPLLSGTLVAASPSLGKLGNLGARSPLPASSPKPQASSSKPTIAPTPRRGWGSSVLGQGQPAAPSPPQSTKPGPVHRPTPPPAATVPQEAGAPVEDVPEDWEDDA